VVSGHVVEVEKIDDQRFTFKFGAPNPGFLHYLATGGSFFAAYAPKHHYVQYHIKYNPKADEEAKAAGFEDWVKRFQLFWHKWKDAETITPHALTRPTLESHIIEVETNTQRRQFVANPYFFKVDSAGNQLPYIDRHHERFLDQELFVLSVINGEVDQKAQTISLSNYPVIKENEAKAGYSVQMPPGGTGPYLVFNFTHKDPVLRKIYSDARFRQAMSLAINRNEINEVLYFGLGRPEQALPLGVSFVTDAQRNYMVDYDPGKAKQLLDEMGLKTGPDGVRLRPDGKPLTILWEYSLQFTSTAEFPALVADYWKAVGVNVLLKEVTTQLTREKSTANDMDVTMEWDVPFEPNLISEVTLYIPPYSDLSPLTGVPWREWFSSNGAQGEEPPAWVKRLYELAGEWKTVLPGSDRYMEIGRELVSINQENMAIIGTVADLPGPTVVSNKLGNVTQWTVQDYNYGRTYPFRADQWYFKQ
jgi:peptide/nickel transport system substrate-binding protein